MTWIFSPTHVQLIAFASLHFEFYYEVYSWATLPLFSQQDPFQAALFFCTAETRTVPFRSLRSPVWQQLIQICSKHLQLLLRSPDKIYPGYPSLLGQNPIF